MALPAGQVEPLDVHPVQLKLVGLLVQLADSNTVVPTGAVLGALIVQTGTGLTHVTWTWAVLPAPPAFDAYTE